MSNQKQNKNKTSSTTVNTKGAGWLPPPRPQAHGWAGRAQGCAQSAGCTLMMGAGASSLRDRLFASLPLAFCPRTRSVHLQAAFSLALAANCPPTAPHLLRILGHGAREPRLEATRLTSKKAQEGRVAAAPTTAGASPPHVRPCPHRAGQPTKGQGTRAARFLPRLWHGARRETASLGLMQHPGGGKGSGQNSQSSEARRSQEGEFRGRPPPRALISS